MGRSAARALVLACLLGAAPAGCGQKSSQPAPERKDAGLDRTGPVRTAPIELQAVPLGLSEVAGFAWRKRAGQPPFRIARKAESREDWVAAVAACREALAADPGHLEASWLLAAALGKLGKVDEVLEPLRLAVAGDFGKWGLASLELPALQGFLATPIGEAWRRRVEQDRSTFLLELGRSTIVNADGDLFAFDLESARWLRVTRTSGAVISGLAIPGARKIAYVARQAVKGKRILAVGVVDLGRGRTTRAVDLGTAGPLTIAFSQTKPEGFWIGAGGPKLQWRALEDDHKLVPVPAKTARPSGPRLEIASTSSRLQALPVPTVTADWDDHGLASAIRIGSSNRVVSAPSPGLIDGNTAAWSPGKSHLAFVAQLDETCLPGAVSSAAYIADAATGKLQEIERATGGLAIEWLTDRKLVVAGDRGVTIIDLDGAEPRTLVGATNLVVPRKRPRCSEEPVEEPPLGEELDINEATVGVEPTDAGVVEPP
ncbi:MAG: hypothetical protein JWP01_1863 [Myxococcales bacterium]|nr:hypothetical protein [Myxococcales bacterium]